MSGVKKVKYGVIFEIKEFGVYDGPGLRVTVFFKGCPLRCLWCHNPEGLHFEIQTFRNLSRCKGCGLCESDGRLHTDICPDNLVKTVGCKMTARELAGTIMIYGGFMEAGGGVTFSGGEPLMQHEFLMETLDALPAGLHKVLETSGYAGEEIFRQTVRRFDLVYIDLKHMDDEIHRRLTGVSNRQILENIQALQGMALPYIVRIPLIPGLTDTEENLRMSAVFLRELRGLSGVELLPYNKLTGAKYRSWGLMYHPEFDETKPVNANIGIFKEYGLDGVKSI